MMAIRWAVRTPREGGVVVSLGNVEAPDRRRAMAVAHRRWPAVPVLHVQSYASLRVAEEEDRAREEAAAALLAVPEAARVAGLTVRQVYDAIDRRELVAQWVPGLRHRRIDPGALRRWMVRLRNGSSDGGDGMADLEEDDGIHAPDTRE